MKALIPPSADRVQAFIASIDSYEPTWLAAHEDAFRLFARYISRSIDGRYLERHPAAELLPDLEQLMAASLKRAGDDIIVSLREVEDPSNRRCVLITCMADQRFIYSIVRMGLEHLGLKTYRIVNSVVPVQRDQAGIISTVGAIEGPRESFIWVEVEADQLSTRRQEIEDYLRARLIAARSVVTDFDQLTGMVTRLAERFEKLASQRSDHRVAFEDNARLLRWLLNEHFVFLGTRFLPGPGALQPADAVGDSGIGTLSDFCGIQIEAPEQDILEAGGLAPFLWIRKSRTEAWVYRAGRADHILVQCFDVDGQVAGLLVIEGLFSYPALAEPRTSVPMLDRIIDRLYTQLKAIKGSHRYRTIRNAFNSLPLEYLFALPIEDIRKLVDQVLEVDAEHRSQIYISCDEQQGIAFVFVALPRSHYSDEVRIDIRRLLKERFAAISVDDGVYAGNFDSVTFHYFITGASNLDSAAQDAVKAEIDQMASPWTDRLKDELTQRHGTKKARLLHAQYSEAFPNRYREETSIARASEDIAILETIGPKNRFDCDLYQEGADRRLGVTRLRMFQTENMHLSDILPVLDNFGLVVIDQFPTTVHVPGRAENLIATFRLGGVNHANIDLVARRNRLCNAIRAVVLGAMSNEPLNRLLLRADIAWPSVVLIIAYQTYARQIGLPYAQATVQETLIRHADIVQALTELFRAKFDPDMEEQSAIEVDERRLQLVERNRRAVLMQLDAIDELISDHVMRTLYNLIEATVRTNYYARDPNVDHHVVLKFDPQQITRMPEPRPYREIMVMHPQMAGLHMRGGPVARGGIRWSDRLLDFRTEVLGLMVTQNLKNVLIVPRGAKGAFVLRQPSLDMATRRAQADQFYQIFIRGLLDVTDNLVDGKPQGRPRVLCYDAPDHYLVVAADKGTAHLSDTANALAQARGFWLGDAFASGGSKGYDHKKEGITSRGAWACVRRHFREMNVDPERDRIRVVGIGDMSGDVFGNGMLRSRSMQLVAAFDHRNIIIDPDPDPARSFAARLALFEQPRSSWEDYPRDALSAGGGIYPRGAKSIRLSLEARAALGIAHTALSGPELMQAILRAPVDLLWNGGIGTYIKAGSETQVDVGDPANDILRVDAAEVRAKVLGEGGNLGITAAGRIELAARGARLNADAVDNSAGVDLSDHEVNLKILFQNAHGASALSEAERDTEMERLRVQVGHKVVHNNWLQSRMISLDELRSRRDMARFQRAIAFLAARVPFRRRDSDLPGERTARTRAQKGEGLYRPELAFIASYAKLDLRQELSRLAEDFPLELLRAHLLAYFPAELRPRFEAAIDGHPLAINIARTMLTNGIIADAGASWMAETASMSGRSTTDILRAYLSASALLGAGALKQEVDRLEPQLEANQEYRLRLGIEDALENICNWLLRLGPAERQPALQVNFTTALRVLPQVTSLSSDLAPVLLSQEGGVPTPDFLATLTVLPHVNMALDIAQVATIADEPVLRVAQALVLVGDKSGLLTLIGHADRGSSPDGLDRPARLALREQLRGHLRQITRQFLQREAQVDAPSGLVLSWLDGIQRDLATLGLDDSSLPNLVMAVERVARHAFPLQSLEAEA